MSSYAGECIYCGKQVMHKTFLGTLHLCTTPEQREAIDTQSRAIWQQQQLAAKAASNHFKGESLAAAAYKGKIKHG